MADSSSKWNGTDLNDISINTYVASNTWTGIKLGVQATHVPSGLTAKCSSERSDWMNRKVALDELAELVACGYQLPLF